MNPQEIRREFGCQPAGVDQRWLRLVDDSHAHDLHKAMTSADDEARPALQAQFKTYLAAAHAIFPEEVEVVYTTSEAPND